MGLASKLKTLFRGDISIRHLPLEMLRRRRFAEIARLEKASLDKLNAAGARLLPEFAKLSPAERLEHFREAGRPSFWSAIPKLSSDESRQVVEAATQIVEASTWEVMGFGPLKFEGDGCWRRDPLSGHDWGLAYHGDTALNRDDDSDVRVLWEVNRFAHTVTLALAYRETTDERFAETFFSHIESWAEQNPYARGANWGCAMEAALRGANLLAAFDILRASRSLTEQRLDLCLKLFDEHGRFIVDNSEFSYVSTSNHYLSDVVGLFWVGTTIPELECASEWRETGLSELLSEMDKQVLPDGVDFEASTGYHRFVTEMLLKTFLLARQNRIEIARRYWQRLGEMVDFLRDVGRPDGRMPMIGDCDGSRFIPTASVDADETAFLFRLAETMSKSTAPGSSYPDAGIYVMRDDDLYLAFNASDCGLNGRGSHGHNDALSIEVAAFGVPFIIDPGSYAYNLDLEARHRFRSTAYHSTVMIDGVEQNATDRETPFVIGNEAKPKVVEWATSDERIVIEAAHYGYRRLSDPVTHRRRVTFDKRGRHWMVEDLLAGDGRHQIVLSFHFAPGVSLSCDGPVVITANGKAKLLIAVTSALGFSLDEAGFSRNYGQIEPSTIGRWSIETSVPFVVRSVILPLAPDDDRGERLELARGLADNK